MLQEFFVLLGKYFDYDNFNSLNLIFIYNFVVLRQFFPFELAHRNFTYQPKNPKSSP